MIKNILVASDSFKNSMDAKKVGDTIKKAFLDVKDDLEIINLPIADGGEGTTNALIDATEGSKNEILVTGPLNKKINAFFGISLDKKTAFIEMASASGIELISSQERNPMLTTTIGTGELILAALEKGVEKIIIGIGGSATTDGGAGMAYALGVRFYDQNNNSLYPNPENFKKLVKVDMTNLDKRLKNIEIKAACDVENILVGNNGSAAVFGPQKGATPLMIKELDQILDKYANLLPNGKKIMKMPGSGAAGGLGFGLALFCNAKLEKGFSIVCDYLQLENKIKSVDLIITGEGQIDFQSVLGKAPVEIAKIAKHYKVPAIAFVGSLGKEFEEVYKHGLISVYPILGAINTLEKALKDGEKNLYNTAFSVARTMFKI